MYVYATGRISIVGKSDDAVKFAHAHFLIFLDTVSQKVAARQLSPLHT
jgi:hypothetical protein